MPCSRRQFGRVSLGTGSMALLAGCSDRSDGDPDESRPATSSGAPTFDRWVPLPEETSGSSRYASSDVVFRNVEAMDAWGSQFDAAFASRELVVQDLVRFDVDPDSIASRVDVADASAHVYRGSFDAELVRSGIEADGFTLVEEDGAFDVYVPDEQGFQYVVGIGDEAVVMGVGAGIETEDGATSEIDKRRAVTATLGARRAAERRYVEANPSLRTLAEAVAPLPGGDIRTYDRVTETSLEEIKFEGARGDATGIQVDGSTVTYVLLIEFSDASEARVDPVRTAIENHWNEPAFDPTEYASEGRIVSMRANVDTDKLD